MTERCPTCGTPCVIESSRQRPVGMEWIGRKEDEPGACSAFDITTNWYRPLAMDALRELVAAYAEKESLIQPLMMSNDHWHKVVRARLSRFDLALSNSRALLEEADHD